MSVNGSTGDWEPRGPIFLWFPEIWSANNERVQEMQLLVVLVCSQSYSSAESKLMTAQKKDGKKEREKGWLL